tara:strand:- start:514 stop:687 length:174 start_codon:yes stop_codon:yes gene_type:complete
MPVWLRRFTFSKLKEHYDNLNKDERELQPAKTGNKVSPPDVVQKAMAPTYSTKASSK